LEAVEERFYEGDPAQIIHWRRFFRRA